MLQHVRRTRAAVAWLALFVALGCNDKQRNVPTQPSSSTPGATTHDAAASGPSAAASAPATAASGKIIGTAKLETDGTLVVTLYAQGPIHGQTQKRYAKGDPKRERMLEHVGGLSPGEEKPVPAFPDDIDDARVQAAVKKHIANQSWAEGARITITGTDQQGRVAVTAVGAAPPREGLALRLDPKSYAVVEETPLRR